MAASYDFVQLDVFTQTPLAGRPTLGTALYLYSTTNTAPDEIVLDLNVGKIPARFSGDSTRARNNRAEGDVFGEMRQRDPEFGAILPREDVARESWVEPDLKSFSQAVDTDQHSGSASEKEL
jgi:cytochrome oxidase assembly protein ShyY1